MTEYKYTGMSVEEQNRQMSEGYWNFWNSDVQSAIDRDIEANRKADAFFKPAGLPPGADVKVEQIKSEFIFGAHIFNFDQLGTDERNRRYKELYGSLFNSATIAYLAFISYSLIFAAIAFPVLLRAKNPFAKKTVALRL